MRITLFIFFFFLAENFCWERDDMRPIVLNCSIAEGAQPRSIPTRMWLRNGILAYSSQVGESLDPNPDFFIDYPILMMGIFQPNVLTATSDGKLFYVDDLSNITMPDLLPPGITTLEEAQPQLFNLSLGNWTCVANSTLGTDSVTYEIRECGKHIVS